MSKIQKIKITNFKAIGELEVDFNGCTAIVTGGNDKGKSSFLRGIPERIRFNRPDVMVKQGEAAGTGEMTLDTGEKFVWEFDNNGKDKLTYITDKGIKSSVTTELGAKFFPPQFDIDKFLQSAPKKQSEQLQKIIGIDFTDIEARYRAAYDDRTDKNKDAERYHAKLIQMLKVDEVKAIDITELQSQKEAERKRLNDLYASNKAKNDESRKIWSDEKEKINKDCISHNEKMQAKTTIRNECIDAHKTLIEYGYKGNEVDKWLDVLAAEILPNKIATELHPKEPEYITEMPDDTELQKLDAKLLSASETNAKAKEYQDYIAYKATVDQSQDLAKEADEKVKSIENERQKMIESANFPKGVSISNDGIMVDGLPFTNDQISSSKKYTTALRIGAMGLGEVRALYFDASLCDRNTLSEIEGWAAANGLQLLIERADFDGGEIKYELIEN